VLVTPLTRRKFDADGKVVKSLAEERTITKNVGHDNHFKWIDLNLASEKYVSAIGETEAHKYNKDATDNVHLNKRGAVVFARIVSDLLVEKYPANFQAFAKPDADLSALIAAGKPA
jgi:lysophospholipase L1-like esterase